MHQLVTAQHNPQKKPHAASFVAALDAGKRPYPTSLGDCSRQEAVPEFTRGLTGVGMDIAELAERPIPWLGARALAAELQTEMRGLLSKLAAANKKLAETGALTLVELEAERDRLQGEVAVQQTALKLKKVSAEAEIAAMREQLRREADAQSRTLSQQKSAAEAAVDAAQRDLRELKQQLVATEEIVLLQEAGVYAYRHPLTDVVAYEKRLAELEGQIKAMASKDGGAAEGTTNWIVNDSAAEGRKMVRDFSKLMLRAFNAEADNLVRGMKPYKLEASKERLSKVADTIARLGKTMKIRISHDYYLLRMQELELTADYLEKMAEEKELERKERERLKEERKVQQEIERERQKLEKERKHFDNALEALVAKGDEDGAARVREQLADVDKAISDVDYRAANIRAGYVYLISNIGSFGERMVKVGMTRRLDPLERIKELSDASVPFNFDVHALFFSKDAVGIETAMHDRLGDARVNLVNRRREFFHATPLEVKAHLAELAGELLQFQEIPEALEYRQGLAQRKGATEGLA